MALACLRPRVQDTVSEGVILRAGLISYFDLGTSHGLTDAVIRERYHCPEPDIGLVGIRNPLGEGTVFDLLDVAADVVNVWRKEAIAQVRRPEMETGWEEEWHNISRPEFDTRLAEIIRTQSIELCNLTLFALGTVFLRFELASGIEPRFLIGVLACFEYAAYRPAVSDGVLRCARDHCERAMLTTSGGFSTLTARPSPEVRRSVDGYEESTLFTAFTSVIRCVDAEDREQQITDLLATLDMTQSPVMDFEYHGRLHYSWPTCVLQPRGMPPWTPEQELLRILECIKIAHVCLGACEAFLRLFQAEIQAQVESYVTARYAGRGPHDLNKLRTLALAVVSLTNFARVTQSEEDQEYFQRFAENANLERTHQLLTDSVEVLYSVQEAEAQAERSRRESVLNVVVLVLALLTLVSVTVDAYNFVRDQEVLIHSSLQRVEALFEFLLAVTLVVALLLWWLPRHRQLRPRPRRLRGRKSASRGS